MRIAFASTIAAGVLVLTAGAADSGGWSPEVQVLAEKAQEHYEAGRLKDAEATYLEALKLAPENLHLLSYLGVVQFQAKKYKLAEETLRKAIKAAPGDEFAYTMRGIVYLAQGNLDPAIDELTKALAINPKNATAHQYLGIAASQKGWAQAAQKQFQTAAELDSTYRDQPASMPVGDFLTPLEKSRLKIPPSAYRPVQPPRGKAPRRQ